MVGVHVVQSSAVQTHDATRNLVWRKPKTVLVEIRRATEKGSRKRPQCRFKTRAVEQRVRKKRVLGMIIDSVGGSASDRLAFKV